MIIIKKRIPIYKKYFSEHIVYFTIFTIVSLLYIVNGYASFGTNDDWALRGMLVSKGTYGTLIMSYPLSYIISRLYDIVPSFSWYSLLLSTIIGINFYFISLYIEKNNSYIQKTILFILALLWLTYLWFNATITILTITTMITAVGLMRKKFLLSLTFVFLAFLLRSDMMFIFIPYYLVSYFILRKELTLHKKELIGLITLIVVIAASLFVQKQDRSYMEWLSFNKARSAIVDMGMFKGEDKNLTSVEKFCMKTGWWQDEVLFPTKKLIATTPPLTDILKKNIQNIHLVEFIKSYKFKHWLWLLLGTSLLIMVLNIRHRKAFFIPFLVVGIILLLITRDVERVTVPMIMLWAYVVFESLKDYRIFRTIFLLLFTYIFYYYASGQLTYRYFKENTLLQKEAHQLIAKSNKVCEVSMNFPTATSGDLNMIFIANYLFYENYGMQMNDKEILPGGWLVRHEYFYKTHHISDHHTKRKYSNYHEFLIDDNTAFFGSRQLVKGGIFFTVLLKEYDKLYLKDRPSCHHTTSILIESEHFAISQIKVDCNATDTK